MWTSRPTASLQAQQPAVLLLRMAPDWALIDDIRRFVEAFCNCVCPDACIQQDLGLAAHELLQNAVSYSGHGQTEICLSVEPMEDRISITVSNESTPSEYERLKRRLEEMEAEADPMKMYVNVMKKEAHVTERSGLGLARVRCEAGLRVRASMTGTTVKVEAVGDLPGAGASSSVR